MFSSACPLSAGTGPLQPGDTRKNLPVVSPNPADTTIADSLVEAYYKRYSVLYLVNNMPEDQKKSVRWYIDCGDDDFLFEGNSLVHIAMRKKEIPHEFRTRDGGHNWTYWRSALPEV